MDTVSLVVPNVFARCLADGLEQNRHGWRGKKGSIASTDHNLPRSF